jgi:hypothetical protein
VTPLAIVSGSQFRMDHRGRRRGAAALVRHRRPGLDADRFVIQHALKALRTRGCAKVCAVGAAVCASCIDVRSPDER